MRLPLRALRRYPDDITVLSRRCHGGARLSGTWLPGAVVGDCWCRGPVRPGQPARTGPARAAARDHRRLRHRRPIAGVHGLFDCQPQPGPGDPVLRAVPGHHQPTGAAMDRANEHQASRVATRTRLRNRETQGRMTNMNRAAAAIGSTIFFALAPGTLAGLIPWWLTGWH